MRLWSLYAHIRFLIILWIVLCDNLWEIPTWLITSIDICPCSHTVFFFPQSPLDLILMHNCIDNTKELNMVKIIYMCEWKCYNKTIIHIYIIHANIMFHKSKLYPKTDIYQCFEKSTFHLHNLHIHKYLFFRMINRGLLTIKAEFLRICLIVPPWNNVNLYFSTESILQLPVVSLEFQEGAQCDAWPWLSP